MGRFLILPLFFANAIFAETTSGATLETHEESMQRLEKKCRLWGEEEGLSGGALEAYVKECINEASGSGE